MTDLEIRRPRAPEVQAVRMLLGSAFGAGFDVLLASLPRPPFLAGAATWRRLPGRADSLHVAVAPSCRGQRVGSALVESVCAAERDRKSAGVEGWTTTPEGDTFARSAGFASALRMVAATTGTNALQRRFGYDIALPPGLQPAPFSAHEKAIARIWEAEISAGARAHWLAAGGYDRLSLCVSDSGGAVAGFLLFRMDESGYHVAGIWVAPAFRRTGRLAMWLVRTALSGAPPGRSARFEWLEHQRWTRRLAERAGIETAAVHTLFRRSLEPAG